ncbi:MAG: ornithine cyclodeaminase family protein [Dehalococcoidales bacterium]|jgi:alanine dehydrogenase|nr:ornithine cyclodeaminase family protein [Dehalococcoidales bacterium]
MSTLILDRKTVRSLLDMKDVIRNVEDAFRMWGEGKGSMPPKAYLTVEKGDFRAMPAALPGCAGMKWVNAHPNNRGHNLPSVMAVMIYNDPATGYPLAIMDATDLTAFRTGAAAAIASRYLARRDAKTLGIVGAGYQAYTQILAHAELFSFEAVNVYDINPEAALNLSAMLPQIDINVCSIEKAVTSDIVCTLTPSRQPIIRREWIINGTHINAVGADAAGKQELEPQILKDAVVVVDDIRQATGGGEINVPITRGLFSAEDVRGTLADVILGRKQGRSGNSQITVFDSTGIAIEDIATARMVYERALQKGGYPSIDLVEA